MHTKSVHIVSFDIPFPANYGGVIDVFYKIKYLSETGVQVYLHCFEYGREHSQELERLCTKVYYYPRKNNLGSHFSLRPYIVKSRRSETLIQNLLKDDAPIIFEGMHTMGIGLDKRLKHRRKIYRESNIEHHYYKHLAKADNNLLRKLFFYTEAFKLKLFQKQIRYFDAVAVVSESDQNYLSEQFPDKHIDYIPSFHENNQVISKIGQGDYALYNGNLSVGENIKAVEYLIDEVFSKTDYPFIVAGLNPDESILEKASKYPNIEVRENLPEQEMHALIQNAQFNVLITFQATGLKLKLLNTLFKGRFCIVNSKMTKGTGLNSLCISAETPQEIIALIEKYKHQSFDNASIENRQKVLSERYGNRINLDKLTALFKLKL